MGKRYQVITNLACLFVILFLSCNSSNKELDISKENTSKYLLTDTLNSGTSFLDVNIFLQVYADSINNYKLGKVFPNFLNDDCFDIKPFLWPDLHHPISLRKILATKLDNDKSLLIILSQLEHKSYSACEHYTGNALNPVVPDIEKSFQEILNERYLELITSGTIPAIELDSVSN